MRIRRLSLALPEAVVLILAAANFGYLWWVGRHWRGEGLLTSSWLYPEALFYDPSRLLLASALLVTAVRWARLLAMIVAAQPLLFVVYGFLDADSFQFCCHGGSLVSFVVLEGALAGAIVCLSAVRLLSGVVTRVRGLRIALVVAVAALALGWLSSALATPRCENLAADFVARVVYRGEPFAVIATDPARWFQSERVFRRVGAPIVEPGPGSSRAGAGMARLSPGGHPAPFIVTVNYQAILYSADRTARERTEQGRLLFFAGPGFAVRLQFGGAVGAADSPLGVPDNPLPMAAVVEPPALTIGHGVDMTSGVTSCPSRSPWASVIPSDSG